MKFLHFATLLGAGLVIFAGGCASQRNMTASAVPAGPVHTRSASAGYIPAGTRLVLETNQPIDTTRAEPGRIYSAEVNRPILNADGRTIVPAGSPAELVVVNSTGGGTFGTAQLELAVREITVNGRRYPVVSDYSARQSERPGLGANQRTAETVGGGAVLGTLLGATRAVEPALQSVRWRALPAAARSKR